MLESEKKNVILMERLDEMNKKLESPENEGQQGRKTSTNPGGYQAFNQGPYPQVTCFRCNKKGHYARECGTMAMWGNPQSQVPGPTPPAGKVQEQEGKLGNA